MTDSKQEKLFFPTRVGELGNKNLLEFPLKKRICLFNLEGHDVFVDGTDQTHTATHKIKRVGYASFV